MSARIIDPLITVEDLDALPDDGNRYELFEGELFVSRAPGLTHQRVIGNVYAVVRFYLDDNPVGEIVLTPGVIFDFYNAAIPDALFISNERREEVITGERVTAAPDLMIEIVSPGKENARRDRVVKRQAYAKYGVKEYWVIDPESRSLEIYRLRGDVLELVETLTGVDEVTSPLLPGLRFSVHRIFGA